MFWSRRDLLGAMTAIGGVLAAGCGGGGADNGGENSDGTSGASAGLPDNTTLVQRFPVDAPLFVPGSVRLPVSLVVDGTLQASGPTSLAGRVVDVDGQTVATFAVAQRSDGIEISYYDIRVDIAQPGFYTLLVDGADPDGTSFQVVDSSQVAMPHVGSSLPSIATPTFGDFGGAEQICSRSPEVCPFHAVSLHDALSQAGDSATEGGGWTVLVLMIGTPAFCQTGTCAPGLEFLVGAAEGRDDLAVVHLDVFADEAGTVLMPAVEELGLTYEPVLYICTPDGAIVEQLDGVWDRSELVDALARVTGD
jgi:hypothetical protein